jgi:hypothetical protein
MNYGGGMDHEMSHGGALSAGIDNSLDHGLGALGDGDSREKAKVTYICGGNRLTNLI